MGISGAEQDTQSDKLISTSKPHLRDFSLSERERAARCLMFYKDTQMTFPDFGATHLRYDSKCEFI